MFVIVFVFTRLEKFILSHVNVLYELVDVLLVLKTVILHLHGPIHRREKLRKCTITCIFVHYR